MAAVDSQFLMVREAARRLGVHENTVRNFVRQGILQDSRLPGSRFLRLRADDVERLVAERAAPTSSIQAERRAGNPELAAASQLDQWPETRARDAQENLPELVRRLLVETPGITNISIRSGDGIAFEGYDGTADSAGTSFLPAGQLVFEFGTDRWPKSKATKDYNNRISNVPSPKTFVFITPRRWPGAAKWANERRAEGHFADIKVLDADDLEGWLRTAPSAQHWISEHIGLRPRDAVSLDTWWQRFSSATNPALPPALFLAGRTRQSAQLLERLNSSATVTVIESEWADDSLAFMHAAIASAPDGPGLGTLLVVTSAEAWESILEKQGQATLIPRFEGADVGRAIRKSHHVVSIIDRAAVSLRPADISLPRLAPSEAAAALESIGVDFNRAKRLAALGRRSLPALQRDLSQNPTLARPGWASAPDGPILSALLLVGGWTLDPHDTGILEAVTNQPSQVIKSLLYRLADSTDPVVRDVGGYWSYNSPEEAFTLLRGWLNSETLQRFTEVTVRVLSEPDPSLSGPSATAITRVRRLYPGGIRRGLAQGLALLGVMGTDGSAASEVATWTVRRLLNQARSDKSGKTWYHLAEVLPLLAEAAPSVFVDAVEDDLRTSEPTILRLFAPSGEANFHLGPPSPYIHLLWALETICWSSEYLVDGVRILTRLAAHDPGSKSSNSPAESLRSILAASARHTSAPLNERLRALDAAYRVAPKAAWKLNIDLWPRNGGFIFPPAVPRFRDWQPDDPVVPMTEWIAFTHGLVSRALANAGDNADQLGQLADGMPTVSPDDQERILLHLEERVDEAVLDDESRLHLWERLRTLVAQHRRFDWADWVLPSEILDRLSELISVLEQQPDPQRFAYLFGWRPDLPGVDNSDYEAFHTELKRLRAEALQSVLSSTAGMDHMASLACRAPSPAQLGWTLAELDEVGLPQLLPWLSSNEPALTEAASSWVRFNAQLGGPAWLTEALREPGLRGVAREILIQNTPATRETWQALRKNSSREDEQTYWRTSPLQAVALPYVDEALDQLLLHDRAWAAIAVASNAINDAAPVNADNESDSAALAHEAKRLAPEKVIRMLDAALNQSPLSSDLSNLTGFHIGQLLDYLANDDQREEAVAAYEFVFFRLLEQLRTPRALYRALATDSEYFVQLAACVYRGRNEPRRDLSEAEQNKAILAAWVLDDWKGFPGRREDGSLDAAQMADWINAARLAFSKNDRYDIGDELIGQSLARSPVGEDGAWPPEPVRDLLEVVESREIEKGLVIGRINSRGVTCWGVEEGGQKERDFAKQHREWSQITHAAWPRTARLLRELADSYERDARREDLEAELHADRSF
jgi:excisionase family DNA binding protein